MEGMIMEPEYYAKAEPGKDGSYEDHITRCHRFWQRIFASARANSILQTVKEIGEDEKAFYEYTRFMVLMHDAGKLIPNFQNRIKKLLGISVPNAEDSLFRHELWSAICAFYHSCLVHRNRFPYEWLAILGHHKPLDEGLSSFERERLETEWPVMSKEEIQYAFDFVFDYLPQDKFSRDLQPVFEFLNFFSPKTSKQSFMKLWNLITGKMKNEEYRLSRTQMRMLYGIAKGMLHTCDWIASAKLEQNWPIEISLTQDQLWERIKNKVEQEGKTYQKRFFHQVCSEADHDVIVIAPTGSGKTEAALLWALRDKQQKLMILMPTMVTSNSLYSRLRKFYFEPDECGLSHSNADLFAMLNNELLDTEASRNELLFNRAFMKPVMVATVDQLLTSLFNTGFWTQKMFSLIGNHVIFDEIHAYDTYTLALITEMIRVIQKLNGKVMLMSATMPKGLLKHFEEEVQIKHVIVAEELMNRARLTWRYVEQVVEDEMIENEIKQHLLSGKRVAVIVNTVNRAKSLYNRWISRIPKQNVLCYHSQFTMKDRLEKERKLEYSTDVKLLIATQAAEVSLDISFDIMYSECAPLDALVQRAGRCNRYGEAENAEMIIFPIDDIAYDYVYKGKKKIVDKTVEVIKKHSGRWTERDMLAYIDEVYEGQIWKDADYEEGLRAAQSGVKSTVFDNPVQVEKTRLFDYAKTSIIPGEFYDTVIQLFEQKKYALIALYEVPVSVALYKKELISKTIANPYHLPIIAVGYDPEQGLAIPVV